MPRIGFKIDARPAEDIVGLATSAESVGFDEFWVCEDLGLAGGIAQATAALVATRRIEVGLGIAPAAVRNAAYLAMELAAVQRISGGRFRPGIGHGMPSWLTRVGQHPESLMTCLREVSESVEALLRGDRVRYAGDHVRLDDVALTHPPIAPVPISLGVRGPRGIALAKELGMGVILAEGSTPEYVAQVRATLGATAPITVFVWSNLDADDDARRGADALSEVVTAALRKPYLAAQLGSLVGTECTLDVIDRLTVSGSVETCLAAVGRLADAGADSIVFQPLAGTEEGQIELLGRRVANTHGDGR
jgi:5,10-methylenetetrahydromethanopterin reductase